MPVVLTRVGSTKVYAEPLASGGWLAFLVWTLPQSPAASIDVATAWRQPEYTGYFVMLPAAPASADAFANALQSSTLLQPPTHTGFAWMTYHDASQALALRQAIPVAPGVVADGGAGVGESDPVIAADTAIPFANYGFTLREGTRITRETTADEAFTFHYPAGAEMPPLLSAGLRLPLAGAARACFQAEALINDFSDARDTGFDVACRFYTTLENGTIARRRYPIFRTPPPGRQHLFTLTWDPFEPLDPSRTHLTFTRQVYDVVIETPPAQSYVKVVDEGGWMPSVYRTRYGHAIELRPLLSGETNEPARLVFEAVPDAAGELRAYNLVPSGDFLMRLAALPSPTRTPRADEPPPRQQELLCGLAGTEFVRFDLDGSAQPSTVMRFHPHQPAFAPRFPLFEPDPSGPSGPSGRRARARLRTGGGAGGGAGIGAGDDLLTPQYKTAWVSLGHLTAGGQAPTYTSQPRTAPLFRPGAPSSQPLLDHYAPELAALDHSRVFPMAGYGSSGPRGDPPPPAEDLEAFETQILASVRFKQVGAPLTPLPIDVTTRRRSGLASAADAPVFDALTPQGLRVTVENGAWKSIFLAQTVNWDGRPSAIAFHDPPPALISALQSSDLFLVISNKKNVGTFDGRVVLDGWPFTVNLAAGGGEQSLRNILILKFGKGSLKARASDVDAWTQPGDFNDSPAALASWLRSYIADAEVSAPSEPSLADFVRIANEEHWNGILALRVDVDLQAFPPELKGLLGGMDLERFYGHHLGVLQNRPKEQGGEHNSSLFALILYRDTTGAPPASSSDTPPLAAAPPETMSVEHAALVRHSRRAIAAEDGGSAAYNYRVITLIIAFRNSRIEDFESRVILTILRLFGSPAELADSQVMFPNSLVFDGSFQRIDGRPSYAFTTSDRYLFDTESQIVQGVEFVGAEFSTIDERGSTSIAAIASIASMAANAPETIVRARFQMMGVLAFHAIEGLDLFSFGPPPAGSDTFEGLRFTNLTVQMWFALERPGELHFRLDTAAMTFDTSVSAARPDCVFKKLPLKLNRLIVGEAKQKPKDLGFVEVETPTLENPTSLGDEWYGLAYTLNLGSLGALAEQAGFAAQLLAAWTPAPVAASGDSPAGPVAAFLSLPGLGPGNNGISLQSVLRLNAGEIRLDRDIDRGVVSYVLSLRDISLSFLGLKKLPSSGVTDVALFGSDTQDEGRSSLSWYAAYDAGTPPPTDAPPETALTHDGPGREDA